MHFYVVTVKEDKVHCKRVDGMPEEEGSWSIGTDRAKILEEAANSWRRTALVLKAEMDRLFSLVAQAEQLAYSAVDRETI